MSTSWRLETLETLVHVVPVHFTLGVALARSEDSDLLTFPHHLAPRNDEDLLLARLKDEILLEAVERLELLIVVKGEVDVVLRQELVAVPQELEA